MKTMQLRKPGGMDRLVFVETDVRKPARGEITVRVRASSLNWHDYYVVSGQARVAPDLVPLSDAAGEVVEVGTDVEDFKAGDRVISTYFPDWADGEVDGAVTRIVPGDRIDGFAREFVTMPARAFTKAPAGFTDAEAATFPCAGLTAWRALMVNGQVKTGDIGASPDTPAVPAWARKPPDPSTKMADIERSAGILARCGRFTRLLAAAAMS